MHGRLVLPTPLPPAVSATLGSAPGCLRAASSETASTSGSARCDGSDISCRSNVSEASQASEGSAAKPFSTYALEAASVQGPAVDIQRVSSDAHEEQWLWPDTQVVIEGLTQQPAFNGVRGVVQSLDLQSGRYNVSLCLPDAEGTHRLAKVNGKNLRVTSHAPESCPAFTG